MAEKETERLERILGEILANDAEIKSGAEAAGLDIQNLRDVVLRREDDVLGGTQRGTRRSSEARGSKIRTHGESQ